MCRPLLALCAAPYVTEQGEEATARLEDVCYKPFSDLCAEQSVLQYWRMDRALYRQEQVGSFSFSF